MNTETLIALLVVAAALAVLVAVLVRAMVRGWRHRAARQRDLIGTLPPVPEVLGPAPGAPTRGLYVGSTLAPSWQHRIAVGDLGFRAKAELTRHPEGLLLRRSGATPLWIPRDAIVAVRTERGIAGKALTFDGILAIRWRLPSGTEIDTGFRCDQRSDLAHWVGEDAK